MLRMGLEAGGRSRRGRATTSHWIRDIWGQTSVIKTDQISSWKMRRKNFPSRRQSKYKSPRHEIVFKNCGRLAVEAETEVQPMFSKYIKPVCTTPWFITKQIFMKPPPWSRNRTLPKTQKFLLAPPMDQYPLPLPTIKPNNESNFHGNLFLSFLSRFAA